MGCSRLHSVALLGLEAFPVEVEVDVREVDENNFSIVIVGLPDTAVRESKDRVLSAISNSNFLIGPVRCVINLAPGDLKKEGSFYDLPVAIGFLRSAELIYEDYYSDYLIVGELGLNGDVRPVNGALAIAMLARQLGKKGIILPFSNAAEAAAVPGLDVIPVKTLKEAARFCSDPSSISPYPTGVHPEMLQAVTAQVDFCDIKGQQSAKRALEIAAAGGHNAVMSGPPGSGKTLLAKSLIGILPPMTVEEALEVTRIYSISGLLKDGVSLVGRRPFRSPHHTVSYAGLIGGGSNPKPGEVSLAHNGVLFLDELPEFPRSVLEALRQPLEDGEVSISRANGRFTFPTRFICIAAMNPCPCGFLGHPTKPCRDSSAMVSKYRGKISGPLLDRIDLHLEVSALRYDEMSNDASSETSATVRERVTRARLCQHTRFKRVTTNAQMGPREIKEFCQLDSVGRSCLQQAMHSLGISARAHDRILRVARTIADLEGSETVQAGHVIESISYRNEPRLALQT